MRRNNKQLLGLESERKGKGKGKGTNSQCSSVCHLLDSLSPPIVDHTEDLTVVTTSGDCLYLADHTSGFTLGPAMWCETANYMSLTLTPKYIPSHTSISHGHTPTIASRVIPG